MIHPGRRIVVVDVESTGLGQGTQAVEIAWHNLSTGERGCFIPPHTLDGADPYALRLNGYRERIEGRPHDDGTETARLHAAFDGKATLAGANPRVDMAWISQVFASAGLDPEPWHHRPYDVSDIAYSALCLWPQGAIPGLKDVCEALGVPLEHHTAEGDVAATVECVLRLEAALDLRRARNVFGPDRAAPSGQAPA